MSQRRIPQQRSVFGVELGQWQRGRVQLALGGGVSIPYRAVLENLPTGVPIEFTVGYDLKHSGAHRLIS